MGVNGAGVGVIGQLQVKEVLLKHDDAPRIIIIITIVYIGVPW